MTEELQKTDPGEYKEQLKEAYLLAKEQLAECGKQNQRYDQKAVILLTINGSLGGLFAAYLKSATEQPLESCQELVLFLAAVSLLLLFVGLVWTLKVIGFKSFQQFELDEQFLVSSKFLHPEEGVRNFYEFWIAEFTKYYRNNRKQIDKKAKELTGLFYLLFSACTVTFFWSVAFVFSYLNSQL